MTDNNESKIYECSQKEIIRDMKKAIFGNGTTGIKQDVGQIKNDMIWLKRIGGWICAMIGTILAALVISGIITLVKII